MKVIIWSVKKFFMQRRMDFFRQALFSFPMAKKNLYALALKYGTDKYAHGYIPHYIEHLSRLRNKPLNILEIGIAEGRSLKIWRDYFSRSMIYGIDVKEETLFKDTRIKTFRGDQADEAFLNKVDSTAGPFDIIIDDGGHCNTSVIKTFKFLFPVLKSGGIYVVEDTHTSYLPSLEGNSQDLTNINTTMGFLKSLTDSLNFAKFKRRFKPDYELTYFDKTIKALHFYETLVFVMKR